MSDSDGNVTLLIDDLHDNTKYLVFMTIGTNLPYDPLIIYNDDSVRELTFTTPKNKNNFGNQIE